MMRRQRVTATNQWRARHIRREPTLAEETLWQYLRNRKLHNHKFRRQHPLDGFILDFYCAHSKLVIELDGPIHLTKKSYDNDRTLWLEVCGLKVIRFPNKAVFTDIEKVLDTIHKHCLARSPLPGTPGRGPG